MARLESSFRTKLFECYQSKTLCDVVLIAEDDGTRIEAHRLVLFVAAEFFKILLTIPMKERNMYEIRLNEIDGETLRTLVEYCYTGQIEITPENVIGLLGAVTMYRFVDLPPKCAEFFIQIMDAQNCLSICATADQYDLKELQEEATDFVHENFVDVMKCDEFLELKAGKLLKWLQSEDVVCTAEDDILNGITKWVQFDVNGRRGLYKDLISNVNLMELSKNYSVAYLINFAKGLDLVDDFLSISGLQMNSKQISNINRRLSTRSVMFAIGGVEKDANFSIERFCPKSNSWSVIEVSLTNRIYFAVVVLRNTLIYVIGGSQTGLILNEVACLSLKTMEFTQMTPMTTPRYALAAVGLDDYIYAIGGCTGYPISAWNIVERFDAKLNKWTTVAPMLKGRHWHAAAVLAGKIYVFGGRVEGNNYLNSAECYNPEANAWTHLGSLNTKRAYHGCCVVNGLLYAIGGFDGYVRLDSIERYDQMIDKWTKIVARLEIPRSVFGTAVRDDWVYISGGRINGSVRIKEVEKINLLTGERMQLTPMHHERDYFYICSV